VLAATPNESAAAAAAAAAAKLRPASTLCGDILGLCRPHNGCFGAAGRLFCFWAAICRSQGSLSSARELNPECELRSCLLMHLTRVQQQHKIHTQGYTPQPTLAAVFFCWTSTSSRPPHSPVYTLDRSNFSYIKDRRSAVQLADQRQLQLQQSSVCTPRSPLLTPSYAASALPRRSPDRPS